ncbi:hypothetical protein AB0F07_09850 [Streptomyces fructofermentans]|uniref:hypothetical protein n=1 Tax=Streptomyces fructofermentans TaxID=152141 RepID=UPI0033E9B395
MLRITDARTGEPADATPARRGLTRVEAHVPHPDATGLRVLLVADVLVRALEIGGTPVWTVLHGPSETAELRSRAADLGVRPFEEERYGGAGLGEAQVLHVLGPGGRVPPGLRVGVAGVEAGPGVLDDADATALRLALLARPRAEPLRLSAGGLAEAGRTLRHWRGAVAGWATRPSGPIPDPVRGQLRGAWENDLDVPAVLAVLRRVETSGTVPDGARFETYAYADRLLGLELTRDIGRGVPG